MCNFERTLNIPPPFVVSVAVLIVDIHKSRAVTLYLIKYLILIRGVGGGSLSDMMLLHVMY